MVRGVARRQTDSAALPAWVAPQLTQLVDAAPEGDQWLHEIKYDGYRMHARLDRGVAKLLTRTGLDWRHKYPGLARRRALRRRSRRHHIVQHRPARIGQRQGGGARLLPVRYSAPRRRRLTAAGACRTSGHTA